MKGKRLQLYGQLYFYFFFKKYPLSKGFIVSREANRNSHEWLTWCCINTLYMMKLNDLYFVLLTFYCYFFPVCMFLSSAALPGGIAYLSFEINFLNSFLSNFRQN